MTFPWLQSTFKQLAMRARQNSLHHGLLVKGQEGIGKTEFCLAMAELLLCKELGLDACGQCQSCKLFAAQSHPDMHLIHSDKQIGVDLIRDAIQSLSQMAQLSGNKVLVIQRADTMTESAANALLKTLEEPTDKTYIMLVSSQPERLLPTVLSRCEKVALGPPDVATCQNWLLSQGQSDTSVDFISLYSCAPLRILAELERTDGLSFSEFEQGIDALNLQQKSPIELAEKWHTEAATIVLWLQHYVRKLAPIHAKSDRLWTLQQDCHAATKALINPGVNRTLILANLLVQLPQID